MMLRRFSALSGYLALTLGSLQAFGFDNSRSDNLAVYWGQNSYGATHGNDPGNWQKSLANYCQDDTINAFPIAFVNVFFGAGGVPSMDISNICSPNGGAVFPGTQLPNCGFLAADIQACQAKGKIVTISLGGATGAVGFSSDAQAKAFGDTIWNVFLGGSSSTRPFGAAVLDGIDLDIEGGSAASYPAFVNQIRARATGASKKYYVTAAPQCPFPDAALGSVINAVGFDAIYVQFYNNYCGLQSYGNANAWNFGTWDNWAKTVSPNKNVKVYIGAPASSTAAGSGYVDANTLGNIAKATKAQYSSFGGVMLWDASQAYANGRFDVAIKNAIAGGSSGTTTPPTSTTTTTSPPTSTSPSSGCGGLSAWSSGIAYTGGQSVSYGGHRWTAKWWTQADVPGGAAGVWTDNGACFAKSVDSAPEATAAPDAAVTDVPQQSPQASAAAEAAPSPPAASDAQPTDSPAAVLPRQNSRVFKM